MTPSEYIQALYPGQGDGGKDYIAFRLEYHGTDPEKRSLQRIYSVEQASSARVQGFLRALNAKGYDVTIGMNPTSRPEYYKTTDPRTGEEVTKRSGRRKQDIRRVERVYIDIDDAFETKLARIDKDAAEGRVPPPTYTIVTSPDHGQVIWQLDPPVYDKERAEALNRGPIQRYGADNATPDVSRVLRLPGFRNKKPNRADFIVSFERADPARRASIESFGPDLFVTPDIAVQRAVERSLSGDYTPVPASGKDQSQNDWRWIWSQLNSGREPEAIISDLTASAAARHKPNPAGYARYSVTKAAARYRQIREQHGKPWGGSEDRRALARGDWARTLEALEEGRPREEIMADLSALRSDWRDPEEYARRTVERAERNLSEQREPQPPPPPQPGIMDPSPSHGDRSPEPREVTR